MTPEEKKIFELKLKEEIVKISGKLQELEEYIKPIPPENAIGRVSRMDAINNKSINEAAYRQLEIRMKKLNYAYEQMNKTEFGKCLRCEGNIQIARMMYMPESMFCINCAK